VSVLTSNLAAIVVVVPVMKGADEIDLNAVVIAIAAIARSLTEANAARVRIVLIARTVPTALTGRDVLIVRNELTGRYDRIILPSP
jgi:hypothetical protein